MLVIWPIHSLQMYSDASEVIPMPVRSFWHYSTHICSEADNFYPFAMISAYSLLVITSTQCWWLYAPNANDFLSIPVHQSPEILVCPPCNPLFHVPSYLICSILIPDHYLRSFPLNCLAHCLSIARYSFMYLIFIAYAHFLSSHYISVFFVDIPWLIASVLPLI
jgi:hypothetical protein